jgi:hypothetical protein
MYYALSVGFLIRGLAGFLTGAGLVVDLTEVLVVDLTGVLVFLVFDPDPVTTFNSGTTDLTSSTIGSTTGTTTVSTGDSTLYGATGSTGDSTLYGATGSTVSFDNFFQK